jgi:NAD(P)-dependent dehydrogenase (short-subunit alcohol dehydrogenase family)
MWSDKVVVITGGASGIGREIALYTGRRGARVVVADLHSEAAARTAKEIESAGSDCAVKSVDVANRTDVEHLIHETTAEYGRIDVLINNAGVGVDGEFKDMTLGHWQHVMDVNLWGVVYGTYFVYPIMIEQSYGQIVNVSSLAGLLPGGLMTSYAASKHAVTGLTLGLRAEARQYGIKVNLLAPGFMETPLHDRTPKVSDYLNSEKNRQRTKRFPTARQCISTMMKGIEKDRAVIIAPRRHRVYWRLYRLFPALIPAAWSRIIRKLKE